MGYTLDWRQVTDCLDSNPGSWWDSSSLCEDGARTVTVYTAEGEHIASFFVEPRTTDWVSS